MNLVRFMDNQKQHKFNWKLVIISFIIIIILYFVISEMIKKNKLSKQTMYCYFNTSLQDDVPRDQCGMFKIISKNINQVKVEEFKRFGNCSQSLDEIPSCEGEGNVFHFSRNKLRDFCSDPACNVEGVICTAFYIDYHNESQYRESFESLFTEPNLKSRDELNKKLNECGN